MSTNEGPAVVELTIPGKPEYVGIARLAILGVAGRMRFSYDEVEDIRLAVGEACTTAIERANGAGEPREVRVRCLIDPGKLVVEVRDPLPAPAPEDLAPANASGLNEAGLDERSLGGLLIRILMDEVSTEQDNGTRVVRMTKYVANAAR